MRVPRCFKPHNFGKVKTYQLHHFCDASLQAYGQCSYLRLTNENGDIHCSLVMAKARVAPKKVLSIVRLELMAAVTAVKISKFLRTQATNDGLNQSDDLKDKVVVTHHISKRDEFNHIAKLLESDFKEDRGCDQVVSQEDLMFLNIVRDSMHKIEEATQRRNY